jgi:predicted permease
MTTLMSDVRFALRSLGKSRLFTAVALLSLALGIGANVTVFSMVKALAFSPLPYPEANQLVDVHETSSTKLCAGCGVGTSFPGYQDWLASAHSFSGMAAYVERPFVVSGTETAERVGGAFVSGNVFDVLGVHPILGRDFRPDDDAVGAPRVVLLSEPLWTRRYGADRRIVGQTIRVNGNAVTVIGVMPPQFKFPEFAELWLPITPDARSLARDDRSLGVVARLKPNVTREKASAEMAVIAKGLESAYPEQKGWTAEVGPYRESSDAAPPEMYAVMLGAVGFVLLIVCANLAGLLLARGTGRQREIAIRLAIGATRRQIVRHLLTESILLACVGGALGLVVAMWGVDFAVQAIGREAPFYIKFGMDGVTLAFCFAISLLAGLIFGILPALRASRPDVHAVLKESAPNANRSRARGMMVIGELALALILLAGAGELMKSFVRISAPERGYDEANLLTGSLEFLDSRYQSPAQLASAQNQILDRLVQMPGVTAAATQHFEFIAGFGRGDRVIQAEGVATVPDGASPRFYHVVSPSYFVTVKLPIVEGRAFTNQDRAGTAPVVLINKRLAETLWPGQSPLGRRIKLGSADSLAWRTIVGTVGDITAGDNRNGIPRNYAYVPLDQAPSGVTTLLIRAGSNPLSLVNAVKAAVRAVDQDLPIVDMQTVEQQRHQNYWPYQMYALAMSIFAGFAILLAAIGLYGVIAFSTATRTREIGVRMALGANARQVVMLVAAQGGRLIAFGIVFGLIGAALLLRALRAMLFGASPIDLPVFLAGSSLLATVSLLAVWIPARRAARIDPLEALRAE